MPAPRCPKLDIFRLTCRQWGSLSRAVLPSSGRRSSSSTLQQAARCHRRPLLQQAARCRRWPRHVPRRPFFPPAGANGRSNISKTGRLDASATISHNYRSCAARSSFGDRMDRTIGTNRRDSPGLPQKVSSESNSSFDRERADRLVVGLHQPVLLGFARFRPAWYESPAHNLGPGSDFADTSLRRELPRRYRTTRCRRTCRPPRSTGCPPTRA